MNDKVIYGDYKVFLSGEIPFLCPRCNGSFHQTKKRLIREVEDVSTPTRSIRSRHKIIIDGSDKDEEDFDRENKSNDPGKTNASVRIKSSSQ
ncbi:GDNF-inducible zinc finger protein [Acrasis kona]|uniref:GDNF-inducible zinc finger protein n=1 Tax=Acrasis kona TaxID=1008807 RepID=A0AAW2ZJY7_9EUKA